MAHKAWDTYAGEADDVSITADADFTAGAIEVVTGGGVRLWLTTTSSGDLGTVRIMGPISGDCATTVAFDAGDLVYYNAGSGVFTVTNTDTPAGYALADKAAAAGATSVKLRISPFES